MERTIADGIADVNQRSGTCARTQTDMASIRQGCGVGRVGGRLSRRDGGGYQRHQALTSAITSNKAATFNAVRRQIRHLRHVEACRDFDEQAKEADNANDNPIAQYIGMAPGTHVLDVISPATPQTR